uniref:Uncharacterized protein n=1 Tax=Oryza meridionalis TaxID=40149 RepID=A0A0E0DQQ2_9ORYZ
MPRSPFDFSGGDDIQGLAPSPHCHRRPPPRRRALDRFQEAVLELRHGVTEAWAALWRDEAARLAAAARSKCRAEKELCRLVSAVAAATKHSSPHLSFGSIAEETEMATAASVAVFMATMSMLWPWHPHARRR